MKQREYENDNTSFKDHFYILAPSAQNSQRSSAEVRHKNEVSHLNSKLQFSHMMRQVTLPVKSHVSLARTWKSCVCKCSLSDLTRNLLENTVVWFMRNICELKGKMWRYEIELASLERVKRTETRLYLETNRCQEKRIEELSYFKICFIIVGWPYRSNDVTTDTWTYGLLFAGEFMFDNVRTVHALMTSRSIFFSRGSTSHLSIQIALGSMHERAKPE